MRILVVWSRTHYGRGTPPTHDKIRRNIQLALDTLELVAPGLPIQGCVDEDYGWAVVLDTEQEAEILRRFPDSTREYDNVYIHTEDATYADMLVVDGTEVQATISDAPYVLLGPVARNFDSMFRDWFDHYGRH